MKVIKNEMQQKEYENTAKQALENYIVQFDTKSKIIAEMHHLNTYQYHLNLKLWHLEESQEDQQENETFQNEQDEQKGTESRVVELDSN